MKNVNLVAIGQAVPKTRWRQSEVSDHLMKNPRVQGATAVLYKRFLSDPAIEGRHFSLDSLDSIYTETADQSIERFQLTAVKIGSDAVERCLEAAGTPADKIDGLIVTTCTGYLCPGLTSYIAQAVGLRADIYSLDMAGTGCGAALPAIRAAAQFLEANPDKRILVASVEVCSAAFFWGDEVDLILSNAIFSDGAAACLMTNRPQTKGMKMIDFESLLWPEYRDDLRFRHRDARLCNVINKNVPQIAAKAVKLLHDMLQKRAGRPFDYYGLHPGGRRILDEIEGTLGLAKHRLLRSREVLRDYGNMSSPSILFVLKKLLEEDRPKAGETAALFAFGAGFSAFGAVFESLG